MSFDPHALWAYAHILLFVYWLGADVGLYMVMAFVKDAKLSFETRATLIRLAFYVDVFPRVTQMTNRTMAWAVLLYLLIAGVAFLGRVKPF